jgi:uncharacterized protein (DUF924 family)
MSPSPIADPSEVLAFWRAAGPARWFTRDAAFDAEIRDRFLSTYAAAMAGELGAWEANADGALALLIVLDQMPRNMFRHHPQAYAGDALARLVAGVAIARGFDRRFVPPERRFFYLPFMHSEAATDQQRCVDLCGDAGDAEGLAYAEEHAAIIARFGRFPHRNPALGRDTTAEERAFLEGGGFAG